MAAGLSGVVVLSLCVALASCGSGDRFCNAYRDLSGVDHKSQYCGLEFCCGTCSNRYCCHERAYSLSEDEQEECTVSPFSTFSHGPHFTMIFGIAAAVIMVLIFICCCVCPCCCVYKACCKPRPVVATTTHTTVVTSAPQHYPQQPTAAPSQPHSYQGSQYPPYQPVPVQPGYGTQPIPQGYGVQPAPAMPYQGQPYTPGPPPTYQEATSPGYPPNPMPYSQAAFTPGQPAYPLQPPAHPQPNAPPAHTDFLAQPAYNPDYVAP